MGRFLITGMHTFDSGKTSFAKIIVRYLYENSDSVEFFKPISAHNYWQKYEHTRMCIRNGILFSADVASVREIIQSKHEAVLTNPIHRLYVPAIVESPKQVPKTTLALAGWESVFALERLSKPFEKGIDTKYLLARRLIEKGKLIVTMNEANRLLAGSVTIDVDTLEEVQKFESEYFEECVSKSFTLAENGVENIVIESFNDSVWPWEGLLDVDIVFVVSPKHVYRYDPEKFRKAAFLQKSEYWPIRSVGFASVKDLMKPTSRANWDFAQKSITGELKELLAK